MNVYTTMQHLSGQEASFDRTSEIKMCVIEKGFYMTI